MTEFLKKEVRNNSFELLIDSTLFKADIVLKAAYNFLDRGYFFFKLDDNKNIILQFSPKEGVKDTPEHVIRDYSDELLNVSLRHKLEKENKSIREAIVGAAISNSLDSNGFISIDTDHKNNRDSNQQLGSTIDFDKDIDEILREIENDPDLKIDEAEIERILKEIEEESRTEGFSVPTITLDPNKVKDAKKKFQSGK